MNKPILYPANETAFTSNGLGRLSDAISCHVKETINSVYELEMVYPVKGIHFSDIQEHRYIYCPHDESGEPQPFEIYRVSRPINGQVTVNAAHISYKLNKMVVQPFTVDGLQTALMSIPDNVLGGVMPFTFTSDKTSTGRLSVENPVAIRTLMGGMQGSILDVYGGEWEFDHFSCILRNRRGQNTGVNIRYGKNLTDINKTTDATNFWTGVVPFWRGNDPSSNSEIIVVYNGIIYSSVRNNYNYDMNIAVDASSAFDDPPTQAQLQTWGQSYVNNNAKSGIPLSIKVSFIQLWQTDEYHDVAPLQRLRIGDTVNIHYETLGVDNTARIVEYNYNVLAGRYDSMTVGDVQATLVSAISKGIEEATKDLPTKSFFEAAIERATELITGGYGGYVVINTNAAGQPNEILVMNTPDKNTATRVMRINYQGIAFGTGYNGPFNSAWTTLDGTFDAQQINVINLNAASITTGILKDQQNKNYWNMSTGEFRLAATTTVGGSTVSAIAQNAVNAQTQADIFNKLTNNGAVQGIVLSNGQLYINASYINTGYLSASRIQGGTMKLGGSGNGNGMLEIYDSSNTKIGVIDNNGADIVGKLTLKNPLWTGERRYFSTLEFDYEGFSSSIIKDEISSLTYVSGWGNSDYTLLRMQSVAPNSSGNPMTVPGLFFIGTVLGGAMFTYTRRAGINANQYEVRCDIHDYDYKYEYGSYSRTMVGRIRSWERLDESGFVKTLYDSTTRATAYLRLRFATTAFNGASSYIRTPEIIYEADSDTIIRFSPDDREWMGYSLALVSYSSIRYKHDIDILMDKELDPHRLYDLPVRQFVYNDDAKLQYPDTKGLTIPGFIAEEVDEFYPSAVIHHHKTGEIESWDERRIIPGMLALIQEQKKQIDDLTARIEKLEKLLLEGK